MSGSGLSQVIGLDLAYPGSIQGPGKGKVDRIINYSSGEPDADPGSVLDIYPIIENLDGSGYTCKFT